MEHLALEIFDLEGTGSRFAALPDDASVTVTVTSDVFARGDVWTHSFALNVRANAAVLGTAGDVHGSRLHEQLHRRRARLWADDLPLYLGYLTLGDEADVGDDGNVDVTFESGQKTFDEMVEGAKASQVPLMGDVRFGVALWRERWTRVGLKLKATPVFSFTRRFMKEEIHPKDVRQGGTGPEGDPVVFEAEGEAAAVQKYPRMVFPRGEFDAGDGYEKHVNDLNTDSPYTEDENGTPVHPFCNVALCYQRYGYEKTDTAGNVTVDYGSEPEAQRGYEVMPADRVNSAPNFFVIYWLRCLMKHLDIHVDENQMMGVEDLRRLFMVNTKCAYRVPKRIRTGEPGPGFGPEFGVYRFWSFRRLVPEQLGPRDAGTGAWTAPKSLIKPEECKFKVTDYTLTDLVYDVRDVEEGDIPRITGLKVEAAEALSVGDAAKEQYEDQNCWLHDAYATSECFPDTEISEVVRALEAGFGIRFLFSDDYKRVRIVLLRNIFRDGGVQDIACDVFSCTKTENPVRGFRMTYGAGTEDTHFYYKGFNDKLIHQRTLWPDNSDTHDYSQWDLDADYGSVINKVSAFNKTCYVTPVTGNAYGVKVDKDAKRYRDLHPSLFEYAGFMDAEDGDCTGEEGTVEEVSAGFTPAIMNDLNMEAEREGDAAQRFALFVDEKMRPRRADTSAGDTDFNDPTALYDVDGKLYARDDDGSFVYSKMMAEGTVKPGEFAITSDMEVSAEGLTSTLEANFEDRVAPVLNEYVYMIGRITGLKVEGCVNEGYRLYLQDNYEPNDDGVPPVETHDWGLTLGIMRGSGSDAGVKYGPDPDDGEGNSTWEIQPGSTVTAHPDTCDSYGNLWDYTADGQEDEQSAEGRFSLKLRAEKPNPYYDPARPEGADNRRYLEISKADLRQRGLADQFYKEYSYWVRNARIARIEARMTLAQLLALDTTKRVRVGDVTGFVRKMQYTVSNRTGLGSVTMEVMYI